MPNGLTMGKPTHIVGRMGKPTDMTGSWQELRKCTALSPQRADALFFPGAGGKVNRAKKFCETCPVIAKCLEDALKFKLEGFWAGTTDLERSLMRDFIETLPINVLDFLPRAVRDREEGKVQRRPAQPAPKTAYLRNPLDDLEGPTEEELRRLA